MMLEYLQKHEFDMEYEMELSFLEWEKEQISESFIMGSQYSIFPDEMPINEVAEQYYNETYNKQ